VAFTYDPTLADATSRIRFRLGDITAPGLVPDETFGALLLAFADDEVKVRREIAAYLAAKYAQEPDSISDDGSAIKWGKRVDQWNLIAQGKDGGAVDASTAANGSSTSWLSFGFQEEPRYGD